MVTGDNLYTACNAARECHLVQETDAFATVHCEVGASGEYQMRIKLHGGMSSGGYEEGKEKRRLDN